MIAAHPITSSPTVPMPPRAIDLTNGRYAVFLREDGVITQMETYERLGEALTFWRKNAGLNLARLAEQDPATPNLIQFSDWII